MYDEGQGVPQDHAEAVKWFRKAANQGDATAQYNLGLMYGKGSGVKASRRNTASSVSASRRAPRPTSWREPGFPAGPAPVRIRA